MRAASDPGPLVVRDGTVSDLVFDFWRARLEESEIEAALEWEVCRHFFLPLVGATRVERLTPELLRAWTLLVLEGVDERNARLARLVVADLLVWACADPRKARAVLDLPLARP
jgi:hypothetical protein